MTKKYKITLRANLGLESVPFNESFEETIDISGSYFIVSIGEVGKFQVLKPNTRIEVHVDEVPDAVPEE